MRASEPGDGAVLVLNAGSSSIKFAVFAADLTPRLSGAVTEIGGAAELSLGGERSERSAASHGEALGLILKALGETGDGIDGLAAAGHRIVHGGAKLTAPAEATSAIMAEIARCDALAPLHNPPSRAAIEALAEAAPELRQFVSFDTAFHADAPDVAARYALPDAPETADLRRYGFHGLSYASLTERLPHLSGAPFPSRLLAFHLGNGASACAIRDGASVATTMGYSTLDGLTMGTRCGAIDPAVVLTLAERLGLAEARALLTERSGLLGLSGGASDMRRLLADPSPQAAFAVEHFCYWAVRHAGSLIAAMSGLDAVAFTGGIGERAAPVRRRIAEGLAWAGVALDAAANERDAARLHPEGAAIDVWVVPAEEEAWIARDALRLLGASPAPVFPRS